MSSKPVHVAAGVITDAAGNVLLAKRLPGTHMAGQWEFPGGKLETGESAADGLRRELREELDIEVLAARPLIAFDHHYSDKHVKLNVWRVDQFAGQPRAVEGHELAWLPAGQLHTVDLLAADKPILSAIRLPDSYVVSAAGTGTAQFLSALDTTLSKGCEMIQIRATQLLSSSGDGFLSDIAARCENKTQWLINGNPAEILQSVQSSGAHGVHMPSRYLDKYQTRPVPEQLLFAASCHDRSELERAYEIAADFALLGPVKTTPSHPQASALGWQRFSQEIDGLPLPVYAIGGMRADDLEMAWAHGAQGVAGIRDFWAN